MIPGNVDPRRPDKIQRYKSSVAGNGTAPGEDLTPDYMNILGPDSTSGNVDSDPITSTVDPVNANGPVPQQAQKLQQQSLQTEEVSKSDPVSKNATASTSNTINVIPTSPQYGVAIIPTTVTTATLSNDTSTTTTGFAVASNITNSHLTATENDIKDMNATPNKNDRFKVVKIASAEPFRRGRWKCMDFVDQVPPTTNQSKTSQTSTVTAPVPISGGVYMQTQSLPPHQIQQLLTGFTTGSGVPQYFQSTQVLPPQTQYFYQANMQPQTIPMMIPQGTMQPQFGQQQSQTQQFFQPVIATSSSVPVSFQGMQFIPQPQQNQQNNSAFVPTSQGVQISQSFNRNNGNNNNGGQRQGFSETNNHQTNQQPMVNGFAYPPNSQNETNSQPQPNQVAKNVILMQDVQTNQQTPTEMSQNVFTTAQGVVVQTLPAYDPNIPTSMYTNPQFVASVNSLPASDEQKETTSSEGGDNGGTTNVSPDDPARTNPVVNAIDNKIEQAMDLVKSHLMYTVREEVEVLKEKIAELMERIQQLETENNFLRSQIPKNQQQQQQQSNNSQNAGEEPTATTATSTAQHPQ